MHAIPPDRAALAQFEDVAARITARAGRMLLERFTQPVALEFKDEERTDPVTAVDREVERLVRQELRRAFPEHGILGEEGTNEQLSSEYLWVLDPLDGTANFAGGLPLFGVSLALLRDGAPVVGCLFVPHGPRAGPAVLRGSLGNGARVEGNPLQVSQDPFEPNRPVAVPPGLGAMFRLGKELAGRPGEIRNLGSICHELAMVAGGGFRYAVFAGPRPWDVAAGIVLVREAGGVALTWERGAWREFDRFRAPPPPPGKQTSIRDWARPILVGTPGALLHVAPRLRPRRPPPRLIRWMLARRAELWKRVRRRRDGQSTPAAGPARA